MEYIYRLYRLVAGLGSRFHGFEVSQEITNKLWLFLWPKKKSFRLLKISRITAHAEQKLPSLLSSFMLLTLEVISSLMVGYHA